MAKVCRRLMYNDQCLRKPVDEKEDWNSLSELHNSWQPRGDFEISFDIVQEKAKMSHEIHLYEIATLKRKGKSDAIELRLRCDWARKTGFATVTHLRVQDQTLDNDLLDQFLQLILENQPNPAYINHAASLIAITVLADSKVLKDQRYTSSQTTGIVLSLLSSRYGVDRREMMHIAATSELEREELALSKAVRESEDVLKSAIMQICDFLVESHDQRSMDLQLLNWILSENPQLDSGTLAPCTSYQSDVEQHLLKVPKDILLDAEIQRKIETNWAIRGKILTRLFRYKLGGASLFDTLRDLKCVEIPRFFYMNRTFPY
jgi:hypothetical protein